MKLLLKILTLLVAIGAIGGAVMMWMDPSGVSWGGDPMLWIVVEWYVWGFVALSNIFFVLGLVEAIAAMICIRRH